MTSCGLSRRPRTTTGGWLSCSAPMGHCGCRWWTPVWWPWPSASTSVKLPPSRSTPPGAWAAASASPCCPATPDPAGRDVGGGGLAAGRSGFREPDALVQAAPPRRRPPVEASGQAHERGDEQAADDGRVQNDGDAGADAEQLDEADLGRAEGEEGDGQQGGGGGDDAAGAAQSGGHG